MGVRARDHRRMSEAELVKWDAEIEEEFQRTVAAAHRPKEIQKRGRLIGCPTGFLVEVCRLTRGRAAMIVALCIWRQFERGYRKTATVTLSGRELTELGVSRERKRYALAQLQAVGLIRIEPTPAGQSVKVTLTGKSLA